MYCRDMLTLWMLVIVGVVRTHDIPITGEVLLLEMLPGTVYPGCSPAMTLRCSRNSTLDDSDDMVILGQTAIEKENVVWTALLLEKAGHTVASVTVFDSTHDYTPAHLHISDTNASAEGILLNAEGDHGYLQVTWTEPSTDESGQYECVAHGQTAWGDPVSYIVSSSVVTREIQILEPGVVSISNEEE